MYQRITKKYAQKNPWVMSFLTSFVFLGLMVFRLVWLQNAYNPDETQLTDDQSVETYLQKHFEKTTHSPINVPTGVFISSITWLSAHSFFVSGYVWQQYAKDYPKDLSKGFILPELVEMQKNLAYRYQTKDGGETLGWYFEGRINQRFDYSRYPLDNKIVKLRLWHEDFSQRVVLVPNFSSYDSTLSSEKFGLDPEIVLGGYDILETFYRYRHPDYDTNFGLSNEDAKKHFPELYYNIALKRHALDAMIVHVLPLIVVIILCFSTLLSNTLNERRRAIYSFSYLQILTESAALFFVVLLAHIHLREIFAGVGIVYLEYMYVLAYLCVIYVTVNAFLVVRAELSSNIAYRLVKYKDNLLPKILFLPTFTLLALVISVCFF